MITLDFSFLNKSLKEHVNNGFFILNNIDGAWEFLKKFDSNNNNFSSFNSDVLNKINEKLQIPISESSYELTLRHLEIIAKEGYENYKLKFTKNKENQNKFTEKFINFINSNNNNVTVYTPTPYTMPSTNNYSFLRDILSIIMMTITPKTTSKTIRRFYTFFTVNSTN